MIQFGKSRPACFFSVKPLKRAKGLVIKRSWSGKGALRSLMENAPLRRGCLADLWRHHGNCAISITTENCIYTRRLKASSWNSHKITIYFTPSPHCRSFPHDSRFKASLTSRFIASGNRFPTSTLNKRSIILPPLRIFYGFDSNFSSFFSYFLDSKS